MANQTPFPLMPSKSTELRMEHFADPVYTADSTTILYKFIDAMAGDSGAGSLKKEIFLQRLSGALTGIYGSDLDYIFGNVHFLSRAPSEAYPYNPMADMLTSDQWDEVRVKDQWYRNRIKEFFVACSAGGTTDGIRQVVHAATSVDCEIFEVWRYRDSFGKGLFYPAPTSGDPNPAPIVIQPGTSFGRAPIANMYVAVNITTGHRNYFTTALLASNYVASQATPANWQVQQEGPRNELVIRPHKTELDPRERRTLRDMLDKIAPQDTVITVDTQGLAVSSPVAVQAVAADSTYYQVEKIITGTPVLQDLPAPEMLAIDLDPSEQWLWSSSPELAPYGQFNITQEYGYYYLVSGGNRSPIDSVSYGKLTADGHVVPEHPFEWFETTGQFTAWTEYERADSPDNYPGGKYGIHPDSAPAVNQDQSPYQFPYASQQDYIDQKKEEVIESGGYADDFRYRLPIQKAGVSKRTYTADLAIAYSAPIRDSTVTSSWTGRKPRRTRGELRDPSSFVRS